MNHAAVFHPTERPWLLIVFGTLGIAGCVALIAAMIVAPIFVPDHDWISDTISDLAAGRWEIIMDVGLYCFATALIATALAAAHAHLGEGGWTLGIASLAILAALVIIIGARNEYGDKDSEGVVIHIYLVYGLGAFMAVVCATMQKGLRVAGHHQAGWFMVLLGLVWVVLAPVFLMSATSIDGLLERALGLVACAVVVTLSVVFLRRGRLLLREGASP
ncbi:DUF998 domain-containing protein [Roseovarius sp. SCSIO 43702]|uniref:DUF998 domain-containing protein n=1 Tax=Roseovarius sp. SCSIO 43702 TaxID=2823043 RepID=UPI001C72E5BF|nr:DUF998 domain-containing protein [Roseovarius sp. SCSIO 43702]QYX57372.1 DUF998 domain-containing protein [Roseovarius sp. SCSIO 43702]